MINKKFMVQREPREFEGKQYFSYFVLAQVRGKDVRIKMTPPDKGGYKVLELVFGDAMELELSLKPYEIKDPRTGRITKGFTYFVSSTDENGEYLQCVIKPYQTSDRNLLEILVR